MRKIQPKSALRGLPRRHYARLPRGRWLAQSQCCAFLTQRVTGFGDHEAISTVWLLVSYTRWSPFTSICFAGCCVRSARSKPCTLPLDLSLVQRTGSLLFFFRSAGFYTVISCQPKDKFTDISVDCVVTMPYRSVRKKERNRKYYACNSEQLKARGISLYEEDPGKKKAAAQAHYDPYRDERKVPFSSYYDAHRDKRKASFSSYYDAHREERKASFSSYYDAHKEERKVSARSYYDAHKERRQARIKDLL